MENPKVGLLLVAAGIGQRTGLTTPKQFIKIGSKKLFQYPLEQALAFAEAFDKRYKQRYSQQYSSVKVSCRIALVLSEKDTETFSQEYNQYQEYLQNGYLCVVPGGRTRSLSVTHGVRAVCDGFGGPLDEILCMVHDVARPLIRKQHFWSVWSEAEKLTSGELLVCGQWSSDTVLFSDPNRSQILHPLDRERVFLAQTPQCFFAHTFFACLNDASDAKSFSDESSMFVSQGKKIIPWALPWPNIKLTYSSQIDYIKKMLLYKDPFLKGLES